MRVKILHFLLNSYMRTSAIVAKQVEMTPTNAKYYLPLPLKIVFCISRSHFNLLSYYGTSAHVGIQQEVQNFDTHIYTILM